METVIRPETHDKSFEHRWINLAEERLGTKAIYVTDDFFAPVENLFKPGRGIFIPERYTEFGKWMDGWESRRKRTPGHDYAIIKLGLSGIIRAFDVDTNFFTGNHPGSVSIEAIWSPGKDPDEKSDWTEILSETKMNPGSQHLLEIKNDNQWTHLKFNIYPDGGVARLRVFGEVKRDWSTVKKDEVIDLAYVGNEGKALACSDMYFSHKDNINAPGRGVNMGDGWETKRRRGPGFDWLILQLGKRGTLESVLIDTCHFKGNYPDTFSLQAADLPEGHDDWDNVEWSTIIDQTKLEADKEHTFDNLSENGPFTHVKVNIYPDGGVSRMRIFGRLA